MCRAELPARAHVCLECKSLVRPPTALIYLAALLTSLPVLGGAAVYLFENHAKTVQEREQQQAAAAAAAKGAAASLESVVGLAASIFRARYHLANACSPYFRDPDFFKLNPGEGCAPQLMHAVYEFDQQLVALAYQLDVIPGISHETRARFDSLNTHYWAQASPEHPRVGYRQRVLDALHGARDFSAQRPLRTCGPADQSGEDGKACEGSVRELRNAVLVHLQRQIDATLCSLVADVRSLRKLAQEATIAPGSPLANRILDAQIGQVCTDKLKNTKIEYEYP